MATSPAHLDGGRIQDLELVSRMFIHKYFYVAGQSRTEETFLLGYSLPAPQVTP